MTKKPTDKTDKRKKRFLKALEESLGIVALACKKANISRSQVYVWRERDPEFARQWDEIVEMQVDYVESKLFENINKNDTTSIIFFLKCKGKHRGYVERVEAVQLSPEDIALPDEELIEIAGKIIKEKSKRKKRK